MAKLLVIEDQPKLLRAMQRGLESAGHSVIAALDGDAGLQCARTAAPDAVVLDLMLPRRSGWDVLRDLRHEGFRRPILIVTARDAVEDRVRGLDTGADDYLVKPFSFSELLARLRALLRRDGGAPATRLTVADLELDLLERSATRAGVALKLTNRQFELLHYLARNVNEIVSREMIVRDVWRDESGILTKVVEVSMVHLRRQIERDGLPQLLWTIRGAGYLLKDPTCRE
ncbi:MAG: response regulator transcription factor [Planctomycetaceae bacterium]